MERPRPNKRKGLSFRIINEWRPDLVEFVLLKTGWNEIPRAATVLAFEDDNGILGGWMFERYTGPGGSITMHWAGRDRRWLHYDMLVMCAWYVYVQLGCEVAFGEVPAKDTAVRKVDEKAGFKQVAVIPGYFPNDDLVIYQQKREDCRFLPAFEEAS